MWVYYGEGAYFVGCRHLPSFAVILTVPSLFFCTFSCNNGYVLADEMPTGLLNSYILQYLPISQNSAAIISYFAIKIFFRCSGSSNFLLLLCYSEWEFFLLQGFRDFSNKYDKVSGQFLFFEICQRQQNLKNEKCDTFYSACYSSKFTISPSFKKLFSELERVILPSFFSEL